jgi:glucose-1-phosphate cytidylyltransferase
VKAVILAGGLGTRISEESQTRPKPMVEIGDRPILWHIMKIYSAAGITDFIVLLGYKGYMIKEYFTNYYLHSSDITVDLANNMIKTHESNTEPWSITLLDTGLETMTGGRLLRAKEYIGNETFCFTYGDGVTDLDMNNVIEYHRQNRTTITVTAVQPPSRYGKLAIDGSLAQFREKPEDDGGWINGGYFVAEPSVFDYIDDDGTIFERSPLERLSTASQLTAYQHTGYWYGMDTLRDKILLNKLWDDGTAPWKTWKD